MTAELLRAVWAAEFARGMGPYALPPTIIGRSPDIDAAERASKLVLALMDLDASKLSVEARATLDAIGGAP